MCLSVKKGQFFALGFELDLEERDKRTKKEICYGLKTTGLFLHHMLKTGALLHVLNRDSVLELTWFQHCFWL